MQIFDSVLHMTHACGRTVCEIHIPELNIAYNPEGGCWETSYKERYKGKHARCVGEIDVPDAEIKRMKSYVNAKKRMDKVEEWFNSQDFKVKFDKYVHRKGLREFQKWRETNEDKKWIRK
jgi:hypothetical protein